MNEFEKKELAKFEKWYAKFGDRNLSKDAQWHGFRARAYLARKSQNDPTQLKSYIVGYEDAIWAPGAAPETGYEHILAYSPKDAIARVEAKRPNVIIRYAKRSTAKSVVGK